MSKFSNLYILILVISVISCNNNKNVPNSVGENTDSLIENNFINDSTLRNKDSIQIIDECQNDYYRAILTENINTDSDAFELQVLFSDGEEKIIPMLNFRPRMTRINNCRKDYVIVGFPCGGPCWARSIVHVKANTEVKTFGYCEEASNYDDIIIYRREEIFGRIIIHNLKNGKEIIAEIDDCDALPYPCHMDSIYVKGQELVLEYDRNGIDFKRKVIGVQELW